MNFERPQIPKEVENLTDTEKERSIEELQAELEHAFAADSFEGSAEVRHEELNKLSYEDFEERLIAMNAILRGKKPEEHGFDGDKVELRAGGLIQHTDYTPPHFEDKNALLRDAFEAAKRTPDIQDSALILSSAINMVHPFNDGNGRISRFVYHIISGAEGRGEEISTKDILENEEGRKKLDIGTGLPYYNALLFVNNNDFGINMGDPNTPSKIESEEVIYVNGWEEKHIDHIEGLTDQEKRELLTLLGQSYYMFAPVYKFLEERGDLEEYTEEYTNKEGEVLRKYINIDRVLKSTDAEDVRKILKLAREAKAAYVHTVVDAIEHPGNYKLTSKNKGEMTLRDKIVEGTRNYLTSDLPYDRPKK